MRIVIPHRFLIRFVLLPIYLHTRILIAEVPAIHLTLVFPKKKGVYSLFIAVPYWPVMTLPYRLGLVSVPIFQPAYVTVTDL